jgi:L-2-hydroxyglutarate oxidase LhgO
MLYDVALVGGGIVGLATARGLLLRHPRLKLIVLEKDEVLAAQQTGHNSGVIHSGVYYRPGSLKARLCLEGRALLWKYCDANRIAYRNVGKLIVATEERELAALDRLYARGLANGIAELRMLDGGGIAQREPHCRGIRAIHSPLTGIVDFALVARSLGRDVLRAGGAVETGRRVDSIRRMGSATILHTSRGEVEARYVVTCGGLHADRLARMTGGPADPKIVPFRGSYLVLAPAKRDLIFGNIYPVPDAALPFLGAHFTPRMNGEVWIGPNAVLAFAREGYRRSAVNLRDLVETLSYPGFVKLTARHCASGLRELYRDAVRSAYVKTLQRYVPELQAARVRSGPSGVRAQAVTAGGALVDDFAFDWFDNGVHVRNAPSPAATSALAIGKFVAGEVDRRFGLGSSAAVV